MSLGSGVLPARRAHSLAAPAAAALLGLACLGLLFHAEAAAAVAVWFDSTAYSHCFFVIPIALWLAWERRGAARGLAPQPTAWPALAALPLGLAWFAAERLGLMEGRQLAALGLLQTLLVALLGWRLARVQAAALAYLVFLVPFGSFLVPTLQGFTAGFIDVGLDVLGIPHVVDAFVIEIPEGVFYVAEACAGLRFLIAAVAFGALYACLTYRSPWRRAAFLAISVVVPIVANGLRALGIVVAGHLIGSAEAATADHLIYGWGFFSVVIVLLTLAGLPFRQDTASPAAAAPSADTRRAPGAALAAAGAVAALAAAGPVAAGLLAGTDVPPRLALPGFAATAACPPVGVAPNGAQTFDCGGLRLVARLRVLAPGASPAVLRAARTEATGERDAADAATSTLEVAGATPLAWRLVELSETPRLTATAAWIDGRPDPGGLAGRLRMAWDSVAGGRAPPVLAAATLLADHPLRGAEREAALRTLTGFLQAQDMLLATIPGAVAR